MKYVQETLEEGARGLVQLEVDEGESFSSFMIIRCNDDRSLVRFVGDYADACWWSELWDDLVQKHGDQTPSFIV